MTEQQKPQSCATEALGTLQGHRLAISKIAFSPEGTRLASCSADKTIKVWNLEKQQCAVTFVGHSRGISDVAWHPRDHFLASAADDLTLGIWDVETGKRLRKMQGHTHFVYTCKFHQDGNVVVSGSLDEAVRYWDVRTGQSVKAIPAHSDPVTSLDFICDGTILATASSDGLCRLWDFGTGLCLRTLMDNNSPPVSNVRFSPNGHFIMESVLNHTVRLWDWRTGPLRDHVPGVQSVQKPTGRVVRRLDGHVNSLYCLPAFFLHGTCIASASEDGTVAVWNINSKRMVKHNVDELAANPPVPAGETSAGAEAQRKIVNPETPIAMDIHELRGCMATSQIGDPTYAIRWRRLFRAYVPRKSHDNDLRELAAYVATKALPLHRM